MAKLRNLKRDVDYLVSEIISDCYTCLVIHPEEKQDEIFGVISEVVDLRNSLIERANHPAEKHNARLVKKHYMQIRIDMFMQIEALFIKLSDILKK